MKVEFAIFGTVVSALISAIGIYIYGIFVAFKVHVLIGIVGIFPVAGFVFGLFNLFGYNMPFEVMELFND